MKIYLDYEKKDIVWFGILVIAAFIMKITTGYSWIAFPIYVVLLVAALIVKLKVKKKWKPFPVALLIAAESWILVMIMQFLMLDMKLFSKIKAYKLFYNVLIVLCLYLIVFAITNHTAIATVCIYPPLLLLALINYFVYSFRGNELTVADLKSAGTGLSVAANYRFTLNSHCGYVFLAAVLVMTFCLGNDFSLRNVWKMRLVSLVLCAGIFAFLAYETSTVKTETWEQKGTYKNGFLLNFCLEMRDSIVSPPDGYSVEAVEALEEGYTESSDARSESDVEDPVIIVVMNESFADLRILGDLETNVELMPFLDSLTENTERGFALSSVYSAKTPNSEWEFLTGNSMAFLPQGSVVYQQYIDSKPNSLVSTLSNIGYTCVAMHPYYAEGWSRDTVYPTMGFDEMHFIEDFDETNILRKYITDEELYDKIIERYEDSPSDEKLFIMGITMQNHGGYGETYDNMQQYMAKIGLSYTDVNQYLQLIHESDKALKKLITYFEEVDRPVEIVFFGDHQPGLNSAFYKLMNGKGVSGLTLEELEKMYTVPFFIWTNYDTEETTVELTSLNYLSTMALERANIDLPAYNQFLADMQEDIPAINSQGYYSASDNQFHKLTKATGTEAQWLQNYNILEYNNMFGKKKRNSFFFPYLDEAE